MKILPIEKVREADAYTIKNEPIDSIELMERAARECFKWIYRYLRRGQVVKIFAGPGNNGGDGLAVGRLLARQNVRVQIYVVRYTDGVSDDFKINLERLERFPEVQVSNITDGDKLPGISPDDLVVDAIFGSGLSRPVKGFIARVIEHINGSGATVVAIDIPTGMFADESNPAGGAIVKADFTLSFQFPKYAFFFRENEGYVGDWEVLPIGLHPDFIKSVDVKNFMVTKSDIAAALITRHKFSHKGTFGHALLIAGGYGKMGASVLASRACLRSGVGLLTTHVPQKGYEILQNTIPEAMVSIDPSADYFSQHPELSPYNAVGIGPGIGTSGETANAVKVLIQNTGMPILFDADAINILGENRTWISFVPQHSIFTPHPREFERITEKAKDDFSRVEIQRAFSIKHNVYVVLKGAYTSISCPDGSVYFNSTGNPGMAAAGSGDVLTGVILGMLAQGYSPKEAAIIGVYLHGLAGDYAARKTGIESMIAGDIVENLGRAFKDVKRL
jgi:NAD(P)H-hydrate epimerase